MSTEITVPDIGDFKDVPVVEIHVKPGDAVNADDPVITLESDKATMEVPAPESGVVETLLLKVGDKVSQGTPILVMKGGEGAMKQPPSIAHQQEPPPAAATVSAAAPPKAEADGGPAPLDFSGVYASPSVRRIARELEVDLTKIKGTGEKGRITKEDVKAALGGGAAGGAAAPPPSGGMGIPDIPAVDFSKFGPIETKPLGRIKRISGPHLHRSWLNVPHVTHTDEADITDIEAFRKELDDAAKADKKKPYRVSLLPFLMKACVVGLARASRTFNASLTPEKDGLVFKQYYHIGIAVDTPDGLVVPVMQRCRPQGHHRHLSRAWGTVGQGARGQAVADRYAGRKLHHLLARRHRRHRLHANRQCAGSRDPGRRALQNGARLERQRVQAKADVAALPVLRSSRDRRCGGGALHAPTRDDG